jgi:hypothetical protein
MTRMQFTRQYFQHQRFTAEQLEAYQNNASRDLQIAIDSDIPEVIFKFAYDAMLKLAMYVLAVHGYRVRSTAGHHIKLIEALADLLEDSEIAVTAEVMRQKRNADLYMGGTFLTITDAAEFLKYVKELFERAETTQ